MIYICTVCQLIKLCRACWVKAWAFAGTFMSFELWVMFCHCNMKFPLTQTLSLNIQNRSEVNGVAKIILQSCPLQVSCLFVHGFILSMARMILLKAHILFRDVQGGYSTNRTS